MVYIIYQKTFAFLTHLLLIKIINNLDKGRGGRVVPIIMVCVIGINYNLHTLL